MRWQPKSKRYLILHFVSSCEKDVLLVLHFVSSFFFFFFLLQYFLLNVNMICTNIYVKFFPSMQIYDSAYDKAKEMLQKNCRVLEATVEQLIEYENLTGKVERKSQNLCACIYCISVFLTCTQLLLSVIINLSLG